MADRAMEKAKLIGTIIISDKVYAELKEVIYRRKFDKYLKAVDRSKFLSRYIAESTTIVVTDKVSVCRDPSDNMFLELALSGKAFCIISGDPDLQALHPFQNISIWSPIDFLNNT